MNVPEKIKELRNKMTSIRRAAVIGAFSLAATTPGLAQEKSQQTADNLPEKQNLLSHENETEASKTTFYINNIELNADSPLEQIYKIDDFKAFYSPYLDEGKGGIVFVQYHMSDADAFARANQGDKYAAALAAFAERARVLGYEDEIKSLEDARQCIEKYKTSNKKKSKYIVEELNKSYYENGLFGAQQQKDFVNKLNASNLQMAEHEKSHAANGQYMKDIDTGHVMLSPGGIYLAHMADELQAQISGKNIEATEMGIAKFFAEYGKQYYDKYTANILNDASYKRMFAYSLNEEMGQGLLSAGINNSFLDMSRGKDNKGNYCSVNAVETSKGFVYFTGEEDVTSAKVGGKTVALNCLTNEQGQALKDEKGNIVSAQVIHDDNGFRVSLSEKDFKTTDMDKNQEEAIKFILRNLSPQEQALVSEALKKYCDQDANKLTQAWLQDKDSLLKIREETEATNFATDIEYIKNKRAEIRQNLWAQKAADMKLIRLGSQRGNTLQLTPEIFQSQQNIK